MPAGYQPVLAVCMDHSQVCREFLWISLTTPTLQTTESGLFAFCNLMNTIKFLN